MQQPTDPAAPDVRAASLIAMGAERRHRLNERLLASMRHAHQCGVRDMSRRELCDYHQQHTGEFLEMSSICSTVFALIAAGLLLQGKARACSLPPHRAIRPLRCAPRQVDIADIKAEP